MKSLFLILTMMLIPLSLPAQEPSGAPAPIVFFDIAGPDMNQLREFYSSLFNWDIAANGSFSTTVVSPVLMGTLRQEPPETLFYIGVADVTAKLAEIVAKGGSINFPRLEIPGVVILGMFVDPAGNRVGLVEMENGTAKIP